MTSIPPKSALPPQGQSTSSQAASSSPSDPSLADSSSSQASSADKSYANATRKLQSATDSSAAPVTVGGPAHHGKSTSVSSVSGKPMQQPQPSGVTIVNGGPAPSQDHSRRPSVTISSAGTSGHMPNGGPASRPNSLQFGFANQQSSPNMGNPAAPANQSQPGLGVSSGNPRVTSPQSSPAPIPQPASSGGRPPPSSYQAQGNVPNFGSFGETADANAPLGPGPQAAHLRRESSQSTHSDMGNHMANSGPPRGGYHGGRGRGLSQSGYQGQVPFSPGPNYRNSSNQHRGGANMAPQFPGHNQGRSLAPFPNSPHQANPSPALSNAHPATATPQMNQVPMHPPMPPQHYGYGQHMAQQPVRLQSPSSKPFRRGNSKKKQGFRFNSNTSSNHSSAVHLPPPNLAPESDDFDRYLMMVKYNQGYPHAYEHSYGYYPPPYGMQHVQYMTPPSPQPRPGLPYNQQAPYMQNQFPAQQPPPPQAAPLSRDPSQASNDRPGSSVGQGQPPSGAPTPGHAHSASRPSNSPAPPKPNFVIPSAKKNPVLIKDPSGAVKTFEKAPPSPARGTPSPAKVETPAPTPPPQLSTASDHSRSESKSTKSDEEKKQELKDAVRLKIEQDESEQRKSEDTNVKTEDVEPTRKDEEAAKKSADEEAARKGMEDLSLKEKTEEAKPAAEEPKEDSKPAAPAPADDDDIDYDAIEREMAEIEAKEAAAEADYYAKKQAKKEEQERKEKEEREAYEANMQNAEREAEALEEARAKKREGGEEDKDKELFFNLKKGFLAPGGESPTPDSGTATPVSDSSMGPPSKPVSVPKRDKPAALTLETNKAVEPPQPSAAMKSLHAARFVEDLSQVSYPASIASPNPALNANAPADRKFHYNKEFLLQFQSVFKEKPSVDWDSRVKETVGESDTSRPQSARTPMTSRNTSRQGIPSFPMGNFVTPGTRHSLPPGTTSQQRFEMSNAARGAPMGGNPFGQFGRPGLGMGTPISRTNSSGAMHPGMPMSPRGGSGNRSSTRTSSKREKQSAKKEEEMAKSMPLTAGMEVKTLQVSSTGWKPRSVGQQQAGPTPAGAAHMPPDVVQRKVKAALNKMTPENFERIAYQILDIVSQSKDETDGRTLRQVIQLTFEKATDEAHWAPIYSKFCKRMLESMSMDIKDENIRDKTGNVVAGGSLFRKYLLNRCQEEFERGWKVNLPPKPEGHTEEAAMMSDEYYAAAAAKRRGLGLVKFIGELYKLGMLTERIMHECVKKLVDYEGVPDEAEVESLTSLLRTIGASLDVSEKGHQFMDIYFVRIKMMVDIPGLPSRLRFMLMDIIDLRANGWTSRDSDKGPKTIHEIREQAARSHQEAEMERMRQQASRGSGRPAMGRGDARGFPGGFNQPPPPDYASSKVGSDDLRRLRTNRNANQPMSFGPSSMLGSRSNSGRKNLGPGGNLVRGSDDSAASSRTGTPPAGKKEDKETSSINAFSALASLEDRDQLAGSPPSSHTSPVLTKTQPAQAAAAPERRPSKSGKDGEEA